MSYIRNKLGLYRAAISSAYEAISILRLFPSDTKFNSFYWWGTDRHPHDAIGTPCSFSRHPNPPFFESFLRLEARADRSRRGYYC